MNNHLYQLFKYTCISIGLISIVIAATIVRFDIKNNQAWNDYSMLPNNQKLVERVILGRESKDITIRLRRLLYYPREGLKRGSLELLCTNKGNIYLLMRVFDTRYLTYDPSATLSANYGIEDGEIKGGRAEIRKLAVIDGGYLADLLSNPLSKKEINLVVKALKDGEKANIDNSNGISIGIGETVYGFTNRTNISDVNRVINQCKSIQ